MTPSTLPARLLAALDAADDQLSNLADDMKSSAYASLGDALQRIRDEAAAALSVPESLEEVTQLEWSATLCDGKNVDYATAEKACAALGEGGCVMRATKCPPLPAIESVAKYMRDAGFTSSANEIFKERAAVLELLNCGQEWLYAATQENRVALKQAFAKFGVTP